MYINVHRWTLMVLISLYWSRLVIGFPNRFYSFFIVIHNTSYIPRLASIAFWANQLYPQLCEKLSVSD